MAHRVRGGVVGRPFVSAVMTLAATGLVAAILLRAPLVSFLLVGLLLLCPLLLWVPFRHGQGPNLTRSERRHG